MLTAARTAGPRPCAAYQRNELRCRNTSTLPGHRLVPAIPTEPALFSAFPLLRGRIPFRPLGRFPTRIHRLEGAVAPSVDLWIKRDDESGLEYGGNKVRKLEFLLAEAAERGFARLCTLGGYGSHHVLATALYGRACGFSVEAVVFPQPITDHVRDVLLAGAACGLRLRPAASYADLPPRLVAARLRRGVGWIAPGGSSPTGTLGYVSAGLELAAQTRAGECPPFDDLYVALGSCGTAAGLALGLALGGLAARVVAVRVVDRLVCNLSATKRLFRATARRIERQGREGALPPPPGADRLAVDHRFYGGGYGVASDEAQQAVAAAARAGLMLEPTYTGKAFAALCADARDGLLDGRRVLFWNTFSSVDPAALLAQSPGPEALPPRLRRLFDSSRSA
ncbi:MAG: pyridoxal-phosphate dependent enzyme [Myxococcales bacterium]|nr:pyridoxal-phosphate dependent enzyme [Myxococcales bacterium]